MAIDEILEFAKNVKSVTTSSLSEFEYYVMYDESCFNMESENLEKCIKYCKDSIKWNPECKGKYTIFMKGLSSMPIARY